MRGNTVTIEMAEKRGKMAKTIPLYQFDYGQRLIIIVPEAELPTSYEVNFSNELHGEAVTMIGDSTGVDIPDTLLTTGLPVYLWLFLHDGEDDGETEYAGVIPVIKRAETIDDPPTPEQQSAITQAIAALNAAVVQTAADVTAAGESATAAEGHADDASGYADDAETAATNAGTAQTAAETAQGKAEDAQEAAETAQGKAEDAQDAAETAQAAAETAEENAQKWATGGTSGTPSATNNAKYYSEQAAASAEDAEELLETVYEFPYVWNIIRGTDKATLRIKFKGFVQRFDVAFPVLLKETVSGYAQDKWQIQINDGTVYSLNPIGISNNKLDAGVYYIYCTEASNNPGEPAYSLRRQGMSGYINGVYTRAAAGKYVNTTLPSTPSDDYVPTTKLMATELAKKYVKPSGGIPASDLANGVIPDVSGFYTKPSGGIPASDIADGVIPDPEGLIDDEAGEGDTDKVWSADKSAKVASTLNGAFDDLEETVNGVITRNYTEGKNFTANSGSHSIIDDADACISDYIPVTWGTDKVAFWYTDDAEDDTLYQIWFFDANKDFVSYVGRNPTGANYRSITTPSDVSFARISFKKGFAGRLTENSLTPATIYYTATETITMSGLVQKIGNLSNLKTEEKTNIAGAINEVVDDIFGRKAELSTSISSGGILKSVDFSAETGDKIYVLPSGTAFKNTDCYIYFRYSGESSNTNMGKVDLGKKTYFTLAKDLVTVFVYDSSSNAQAGTVNLVVGIDGVEDEVEKNASDINILKGKKINFLGDSLTHGPGEDNSNSYTTFLANEYGCTTRNYGIIGSTVQYDENRNPMCVRYADMDNDADIVAFMGGTNDYWNNKPLGQFGDTTYDTFYGALDVLISGLIAKYPTAFIYAVTSPHGYGPNFTGETKTNAGSMQDIADAVKQVAAKYSIPVLDVFNAGGLYPKISAQADVYYNSSDGVHLTVAGQKKLANLHATFIKAYY